MFIYVTFYLSVIFFGFSSQSIFCYKYKLINNFGEQINVKKDTLHERTQITTETVKTEIRRLSCIRMWENAEPRGLK